MSYDAKTRYLSAYFARLALRFSPHSSIHSACQVASNGFRSHTFVPAQGVIMANTFRPFVRPIVPLPLP